MAQYQSQSNGSGTPLSPNSNRSVTNSMNITAHHDHNTSFDTISTPSSTPNSSPPSNSHLRSRYALPPVHGATQTSSPALHTEFAQDRHPSPPLSPLQSLSMSPSPQSMDARLGVATGGYTDARFGLDGDSNPPPPPPGPPPLSPASLTSPFTSLTLAPSTSAGTPNISSKIVDAARVTDWPQVIQLCEACESAANNGNANEQNTLSTAYRETDGWTALHHACNRRPPTDVVRVLVRAFPQAVSLPELKGGMTPLHYACRFKASLEVVNVLLQGAAASTLDSGVQTTLPVAGRKDKKGRTPLYYAIRYDAPPGVAESLLTAYPLGAMDEDNRGETPLSLTWDNYAASMAGKRALAVFMDLEARYAKGNAGRNGRQGQTSTTTTRGEQLPTRPRHQEDVLRAKTKLGQKFRMADMLLRAAHVGLIAANQTSPACTSACGASNDNVSHTIFDPTCSFQETFHAVANVGCHVHTALWDLVRAMFSHQIQVLDAHGRYPLHYAAACTACSTSCRDAICTLSRKYCFYTGMFATHEEVSNANAKPTPLEMMRSNSERSPLRSSPLPLAMDGRNSSASSTNSMPPLLGRGPSATSMSNLANGHGHALVVSTARDVFHTLLDEYPAAAAVPDAEGCKPLFLALLNTCHFYSWKRKTHGEVGTGEGNGGRDGSGNDWVPERGLVTATSSMSTIHPSTRSVNQNPNLNENMYDQHEENDDENNNSAQPGIMEKLVRAHPAALLETDNTRDLYPFMHAAVVCSEDNTAVPNMPNPEDGSHSKPVVANDKEEEPVINDTVGEVLTVVFEMLRMNPQIAHDALQF
mmetsp:Transcript_13020/g.15881  ORF Transcript_13020/g.15881 Transcript_13020/m.15881 type:complete len:813 (-) Transcript_13020:505-2943(-)